jgi:uncharacterized protein
MSQQGSRAHTRPDGLPWLGQRVDPAILARALPFALFMLVLAVRGSLPPALSQWLYALQAGLAAATMLWFWREYSELGGARALNLAATGWALCVGAVVFVLWIHLDVPVLRLGGAEAVPPPQLDGVPDWRWVGLRLLGAAVIVPLMEELFWRSFVMRWLEARDFLRVAASSVSWRSVLISALVFGLEHHLWFAGLLAGVAYAWLYRRFGLWAAILSHGLTNLLLGLWVLHSGQWQFW